MTLKLKLGIYLSLKDTQQKVGFLDQSDFGMFPNGLTLVASSSNRALPDLNFEPLRALDDQEAGKEFFHLPKKYFEKIGRKIVKSSADGLVALYVRAPLAATAQGYPDLVAKGYLTYIDGLPISRSVENFGEPLAVDRAGVIVDLDEFRSETHLGLDVCVIFCTLRKLPDNHDTVGPIQPLPPRPLPRPGEIMRRTFFLNS